MLKKYKPFFKCPGGKTNILPDISLNLPENFTKYSELFLGGGAVFLSMLDNPSINEFYLNEFNTDIYNLWKTAQTNYQALDYKANYTQEQYYEIRAQFNLDKTPTIERSKKFFYLNKNCFNGLIRYNSKGDFNSPQGKYKNLQVPNFINLKRLNEDLFNKNITICNNDYFEAFLNKFENVDDLNEWFFYLDPPYIPISPTSNFTEYTQKGFTLNDHENLALLLNIINLKGGKFLLSNSYSNKSFEIFGDYDIIEIKAARSISANAYGRKKIKEILVRNYRK